MPSEAPHRITLTEYEDAPGALAEASAAARVARAELVGMFAAANARLARHLHLRAGPIQLLGDGLRVEDVAGLIRISQGLELEVAPKFLGGGWPSWREDFFFVATLSRYGSLLVRDHLGAGLGDRNDLATLVARALVDEYWRHQRRPLRTYERSRIRDFSLDGDIQPEEYVLFEPDGYAQDVVRFTRANEFNAVIKAATAQLLTEVRDSETRQQLRRVRDALSPQGAPGRQRRFVPSRHRRWQNLYDLALHVLQGFGVRYATAHELVAPGYVLRTPKSWEAVVVAGLRAGLPGAKVRAQHRWRLGERDGAPFDTTPDVTVDLPHDRLLVDAKYKTRAGQAAGRITAADVYESLAFMRAAHANQIALLYPAPTDDEPQTVGTATRFETVSVDHMKIHGFHTEIRGIAGRTGLRTFGEHLGLAIAALTT